MFFGFQLTCGLMLVFYGYSVMKNPRVWGDQGRQAVKAENFPEYCRQNGLFFLKAGFIMALIGALDALVTLSGLLYVLLYLFGLAFAFYPLTRWCKENEGFSWPWPRVESEKKRIKKLRRQQEAEKAEREEKYKAIFLSLYMHPLSFTSFDCSPFRGEPLAKRLGFLPCQSLPSIGEVARRSRDGEVEHSGLFLFS